jgi:hypothetical protein
MSNIPGFVTNCDQNNKAGLAAFLHLACRKCVATIPAVNADSLVVASDMTMRAADGAADPPVVAGSFTKYEVSTDYAKNTFASETGGDDDTVFYTTTYTGFIPGNAPDIIFSVNKAAGRCGVIAVVKDENGNQRLLGDLNRGAKVRMAEAINGETAGVTITITYRSTDPALFYTGAIPT